MHRRPMKSCKVNGQMHFISLQGLKSGVVAKNGRVAIVSRRILEPGRDRQHPWLEEPIPVRGLAFQRVIHFFKLLRVWNKAVFPLLLKFSICLGDFAHWHHFPLVIRTPLPVQVRDHRAAFACNPSALGPGVGGMVVIRHCMALSMRGNAWYSRNNWEHCNDHRRWVVRHKSRKLASASWSPSCFSKALGGWNLQSHETSTLHFAGFLCWILVTESQTKH